MVQPHNDGAPEARPQRNALHLALALEIVDRARREAERMGVSMSFAVVDTGGHVVAAARMDGAPFLTMEIAAGKAFTAAAFGAPSADLAKRFEGRGQFTASIGVMTHGRFILGMGGLPIVVDGDVVGAIGASGGTGEQDVAAAEAALAG
jgi:glc operon protein GlcG